MGEEVNDLLHRLQVVYGDVGGKGARKKGKDVFDNLKSELAEGVALINDLCDKRDARRGGPGARDVRMVKMNQQIRVACKRLKDGKGQLRIMLDKQKAKKKSKLTKKQLQKREQAVVNLERAIDDAVARATGDTGERKRGALDDDIGTIDIETGEITNANGSPVSFDGGRVKTQEELTSQDRLALQQMEEDKAEQDGLLDEIGDVVGRLGVLAKGIGEELDIQNQQLDDLETDVDKTQAHMDKVNDRLGETLKLLNSKSDKLCCYMIFLIIILGLLSIVFNMLF